MKSVIKHTFALIGIGATINNASALDAYENQFGNADATGDQVKYFNWEKDADGVYKLVEGTTTDHDIKVGLGENVYVQKSEENGAVTNITENVTLDNLTGTFVGNSASDNGSVIYNNSGKITTVDGDFIGNSAHMGGVISSDTGTIESINGNFIGNSAYNGGAIRNWNGGITSLTGKFISNSAKAYGGAIYHAHGTIGTLNGEFINNSGGLGGAIHNWGGNITTLNGKFVGNTSGSGGAIYNNSGKFTSLTGSFIGNSSTGTGGAINNFLGTIGILAKDTDVTFTGNTDKNGSNALYNESASLHLNAYGQNKIIFNDGIDGKDTRKSYNKIEINNGIDGSGGNISNDGKNFGTVTFNNKVANNTITVHNGELKLDAFAGQKIDVNGTQKTVASSIASLVNSDLTVNKNGTLRIGTNKSSDSILVDSDSTLTVNGTIKFEENAVLDIDGNFAATDATISFEFDDYVQDLEAGKTVELDQIFATFESEDAAQEALNGFTGFENSLGIAKGDSSSDGLWYNVERDGTSLKVVGVIPEPATFGLLGLASSAILLMRRRFIS